MLCLEQFTGSCSSGSGINCIGADVMFDWTAEITGTRDRSEFKLETILESFI